MRFWRRLKHRCFPKAVLPQGSYIPKMEVQDVLNTTPSLLVARRMDAPFNHCVSKEGNVYYMSLDSLGEKRHLAQMSLDLLGACYYPDKHQRYRTKNVGNNPWDGETIYRFAPRDMFEYYSGECCSVAMEASKLMGIRLPYHKNLTQAQHQQLEERGIKLDNFVSKGPYLIEGELVLEHMPTMLNYWHFQANAFPAGEDKPMEGDKKGWKGELLEFLTQYLLALPVSLASSVTAPVVSPTYYRK